MRFEDYKDKVFDSILLSNLYNNDRERELVVNTLQLFMDIFDYDGFFYNCEITKYEYDKYFKHTFKIYSTEKHKLIKNILKYEEKYKNENK